jgi:hypothetical protein
VHDVNLSRVTHGEFNVLYKQLRNYEEKFVEYLRMTTETFDILLTKIEEKIQKQDTNYRACMSPEERLVVTLR